MALNGLELLLKNNEKNRWGGKQIELNEPRASTGVDRNKQEPENVSSTKKSDVVRPRAILPIVDLEDYDIAEKTIDNLQVNHVIENPRTKNAESGENHKKAEFNFMVDSKTSTHKASVDPKSSELKICLRNNQRERDSEEFSSVFSGLTERFGLLFVSDEIFISEKLKKQLLLHFGHPGSAKMLAERNIFWLPGMKKDIESRCSFFTAYMRSGEKLRYQLTSTKTIRLPVLTDHGQEID